MLGKNRRKKVRKNVFYIHTNIVFRKWGEKRVKQFCQQNPNSASNKCWEKNRRKKVRKHVFYIHINILTKKGGENARNNFSNQHTNSVRFKCWEKDRREKGRKNFFYIHTNIVTQKSGGGAERAKQVFQKHKNSASKNVGKKIVGNKGEKTIFIFTRIS